MHLYVNSAFAKMMGLDGTAEVLGKSWREVYDQKDVTLLEEHVRDSLKRTGKWSEQVSLSRRDGLRIPVEMTITAMPQGGVVSVARDISDRLRAERAHSETEAKYKLFVEQVAAVSYIAEVGLYGKWHYVSPQVEAIFGYTQEEWLAGSENWTRLVAEEDLPLIEAAEENCMRAKRFQAEYRLKRKDGRIIWVSDNAVFVPGSESHPLMEGIIVDITERHLLENQLQQARRMEAVGRLAGGVAHDFNNLLTIIKGYVELALTRVAAHPELRGNIQQIADAAERAVTLVRQLLAFSRKQVRNPRLLDLNVVLTSTDGMLRRIIGEDIEMRVIADPQLGQVKADPGQVEQVIMNLVINARDAMPRGGKLTVETSRVALDGEYANVATGLYARLAITDTGVGMTEQVQAHLFEPFFTTKGLGKGTGLGLATCYGIIKQSGGHIHVYSEPGQGTTFKVYLPIVAGVAAHVAPVAPESTGVRSGNECILLAEDEEALRELAACVLRDAGYTVFEATNGLDALHLAEQNSSTPIQLLLTDVIMPQMGGKELAEQLKLVRPDTKVLFMSGYTDDALTHHGVLEPGVALLEKPFTPTRLAAKVREVLEEAVVV